jgi:hypothetical protein
MIHTLFAEEDCGTDLQVRSPRYTKGMEAIAIDLNLGESSAEREIMPFLNDGRTWTSVLP